MYNIYERFIPTEDVVLLCTARDINRAMYICSLLKEANGGNQFDYVYVEI